MPKTGEVKGCIASFCKVSQSNYSSFPKGIWTSIFRARVFKAALMILLYNGYNSIVVFIFYCHCYATIIIVYIMHFFQYKEIMQIKEKVWIISYLSGRGSPPSLPFAEVGIFFSGGSSWIFPYLLLLLQ